MSTLCRELGLASTEQLTAAAWETLKVQFIRRQAELDINMFLVVPSMPAQYFQPQGYDNIPNSSVPCRCAAEVMSTLWRELGLKSTEQLTAAAWETFMVQFIRRQAERDTNMFVVVPSTPAQYFHMLRRQANLPYKRPLIVAAPKFLHHHRPATSAIQDFTTGMHTQAELSSEGVGQYLHDHQAAGTNCPHHCTFKTHAPPPPCNLCHTSLHHRCACLGLSRSLALGGLLSS
jgi:IS5 family transposase